MQTMQIILTETNNKLLTQGTLVANLKTQVETYQNIIDSKDQQFDTQAELNKKLQTDLKKQKLRTKLMGGAGLALAIGAAVLIN
tara:strand:+ start:2827 stop:3078 length:252 start_codon:yes stop_codon:yes gene_type:complete